MLLALLPMVISNEIPPVALVVPNSGVVAIPSKYGVKVMLVPVKGIHRDPF